MCLRIISVVYISGVFFLWLSCIPLYGSPIICLSIQLLIDLWAVFNWRLLQIKSLYILVYRSLCGHIFLSFLHNYLKIEWLAHIGDVCLTFQGTSKLFPKWLCLLPFPSAGCEHSRCSTSLLALSMIGLLNFSHSIWSTVVSHFYFKLHLNLTINEGEHLLMCILSIFELYTQIFLNWAVSLLVISCKSSFYVLLISSLSNIYAVNIFS